jgi:hypothetical protein
MSRKVTLLYSITRTKELLQKPSFVSDVPRRLGEGGGSETKKYADHLCFTSTLHKLFMAILHDSIRN